MHEIAEIIIPPNRNIVEAVAQVMDYFKGEHGESAWWDFYNIGGRFSGHKLECAIAPEKLASFYAALEARHITVRGLQFGKQELSPATQIPEVDALWREMFPGKGEKCLLFAHSWDQYSKEINPIDICPISQIHESLTCARLIIAGPHWEDAQKLQPRKMLVTEFFNGVDLQDTKFDGKVKPIVEGVMAKPERHLEINGDWLAVTVDYHN